MAAIFIYTAESAVKAYAIKCWLGLKSPCLLSAPPLTPFSEAVMHSSSASMDGPGKVALQLKASHGRVTSPNC